LKNGGSGQAPDGHVSLASFNHYAFGCIGDWLYRFVAGLDKDQPGYKHIRIQPDPHENLTCAGAGYRSVHGDIVSGWEFQQGRMRVRATIPPNTTASVHLPSADLETVLESGAGVRPGAGIFAIAQDQAHVTIEVGSGSYLFEYPYRAQRGAVKEISE
jgi:alpha-L-rhamnosidase